MAKAKKVLEKVPKKLSLGSKVLKKKSAKGSAAIASKLKKLPRALIKEAEAEVIPKKQKILTPEKFSESESEAESCEIVEVKSPKPFLKPVESPKKLSLGSKVMKKKSTKGSAALASKLKKLPCALIKEAEAEVIPKKQKILTPEKFSESESEAESCEIVEVKSPKPFLKPVESPVDRTQVKSGVNALFEYIQKSNTKKTELFDNEQPIFLQISSVKVPKTPNRQIRLALKHALLSELSEICLIVKDEGKARDHESTVEHYEEVLKSHGITNIKTILPYHEFKTEYGNQYELVRKLLGLYDYFLVDARVGGYVTHRLGKIFLEKRKMPSPVKMNSSNLKQHFEASLRKTIMKLHAKSDCYIVQVGHTKMDVQDVFENVSDIIDQLDCQFPGGVENIRGLFVKTDKSISVPVYLTLKNNTSVNVPVSVSLRPKQFQNVSGELSTYLDRDVTVLPTGEIIISKQQLNQSIEQSDFDEIPESDFDDIEEEEDASDNQSDDDVSKENVEDETESTKNQAEEGNDEEEDGREILDQAEEMYLNHFEQEQTNIKNKKKAAKRLLAENKEDSTKTKKSKKAAKKVTKAKPAGKPEEVDEDNSVLDQAEELYLNEYEHETTLKKKGKVNKSNADNAGNLSKKGKKEAVPKVAVDKNIKEKITKRGKRLATTPDIAEQQNNEKQAKVKEQTDLSTSIENNKGENIDKKKKKATKANNIEELVPAKKPKIIAAPENEKSVEKKIKKSKTQIKANTEIVKKEIKKKTPKQGEVEEISTKVEIPKKIKATKNAKKAKVESPKVVSTPVTKKSTKANLKKKPAHLEKTVKSPTVKVKKGGKKL